MFLSVARSSEKSKDAEIWLVMASVSRGLGFLSDRLGHLRAGILKEGLGLKASMTKGELVEAAWQGLTSAGGAQGLWQSICPDPPSR